MKTGLAIIHYNDYESLLHLIENIKNYKILDQIIIYDNHSKEEIQKKLKKLSSDKIEVVISKKNGGYSYAINEASKYLVKKLGECNIIISNSDIIINKEEDIKDLISLLDRKQIGLVAPTILEQGHLNRGWKNPSPFLDSMMNLVYIHKFFRKKFLFYKEEYYQGSTSMIDVASGCFFLIKSKILEEIGYLDEHVFLYYEENILAKKLQNIDRKILISNDILVIHNHSVSIDKNLKKIEKLKKQKQSQYYFQTTYNHANTIEKILLKSTAFMSRMILTVVYFIKDLEKGR